MQLRLKQFTFFAISVGCFSAALAQAVFDTYAEKAFFLREFDAGREIASVVLDLSNASKHLEDLATVRERLALLDDLGDLQTEAAEVINAATQGMREFYTTALSRLDGFASSDGSDKIAAYYSDDILAFETGESLSSYIIVRLQQALSLIDEGAERLTKEDIAALRVIRDELFLVYD